MGLNWEKIKNLGKHELTVAITVHSFEQDTYQYLSGTNLPVSQVIDNLKFISITYCKITSDLSYAKVYFSTLNKDKDEVLKALNRHNKFIRGRLSNCVDIRKMPELIFVYDESIDYGKKIEDIIERIHENE